jgi:dihydrofolate reductase
MNDVNSSKEIILIAAAAENNVLGRDNKLIWHISEDLKRFKRLTEGHSIIMGRKTFESMPKALPKRKNIVLTRNEEYKAENALIAHTVEEALALAEDDPTPFVIGGGEIYSLFLSKADTIELTRVHKSFEGDAFFPEIKSDEWELIFSKENQSNDNKNLRYSYLTYKKIDKI